jgi:hypothetical protein
MTVGSALGIALIVVLLLIVIAVAALELYEAVVDYREGHRTSRRVVEAEWRIHQIKGDAQARMRDETSRHRDGGG